MASLLLALNHAACSFRRTIYPVASSSIETVKEVLHEYQILAVGGLGYGERIQPSPVSETWIDRLGTYEISNGKSGFTDFFASVQLRYEDDFILLDVQCAIECDQIVLPIGPISDNEGLILGLSQRIRGETVSVVEFNGAEHLSFPGYLMRKLETVASPQ